MSLMNRLFRSSTVLLSAPASGDTVQSTESSSSTEDHIHEPKTAAPLPSSPHPAPVVQDDFTLPTPQSPLPPERRLEASRLASNLVMVLQRMPERDGMNVMLQFLADVRRTTRLAHHLEESLRRRDLQEASRRADIHNDRSQPAPVATLTGLAGLRRTSKQKEVVPKPIQRAVSVLSSVENQREGRQRRRSPPISYHRPSRSIVDLGHVNEHEGEQRRHPSPVSYRRQSGSRVDQGDINGLFLEDDIPISNSPLLPAKRRRARSSPALRDDEENERSRSVGFQTPIPRAARRRLRESLTPRNQEDELRSTPATSYYSSQAPTKRRKGGRLANETPLLMLAPEDHDAPFDTALASITHMPSINPLQRQLLTTFFTRLHQPCTLRKLQKHISTSLTTTYRRPAPPQCPQEAPLSFRNHIEAFHQVETYTQHLSDAHGPLWIRLCMQASIHWSRVRAAYADPADPEHTWLRDLVDQHRSVQEERKFGNSGVHILKTQVCTILSYAAANWDTVMTVGDAAAALVECFGPGIVSLVSYTVLRDIGSDRLRRAGEVWAGLRPSLRTWCNVVYTFVGSKLEVGERVDIREFEEFMLARSDRAWESLEGSVAELFIRREECEEREEEEE